MKKNLLATAAFIGMFGLSAQALAQSQTQSTKYLQQNDLMGKSAFTAILNGSINWFVGYAKNNDMPDGTVNEFDIMSYNRMFFDFKATLKNGIKAGAHTELFVGTTSEAGTLDNTYMYMESKYGKVMVGRHNNVSEQLGVYTEDLGGLGVQETSLYDYVINPMLNSPTNPLDGLVSYNLSASYINTDAYLTKISYISPNFSGFQAGITYAPAGNTNGVDDNVIRDITPLADGNINIDATVITAVYKNKFEDIGYGFSAGYSFNTSFDKATSDNIRQWNVGASLTYKDFKFTGAFKDIDWGTNGNSYVFDAGVSYSHGLYGASVGYIGSAGDDAMDNIKQDSFLLTGTYTFAKGIDAFTTLGWGNYEDTSGVKNDGWALVGGMMLKF